MKHAASISLLPTEARHPLSGELDRLEPSFLVGLMHAADREAVTAVEQETEQIAAAITRTAERLASGGYLFYLGAGTSGRLGVLDASECPPTYNSPPELVQAVIAGGDRALRFAVEGAEDNTALAVADLQARGFAAKDVLVGIAASGRTPYVLSGLDYAQQLGAFTIGLTSVPGSPVALAANLAITPSTGPELVTGSTRMKAGTATKLVLNMLSTGVMVRLGYVYGNLMVNVQPTNTKLADRAARIVAELTGSSHTEAKVLLTRAGSVSLAVLMHRKGIDREDAAARLAAAGGRLREALER